MPDVLLLYGRRRHRELASGDRVGQRRAQNHMEVERSTRKRMEKRLSGH